MVPIRLTLSGVYSYQTEQTIDFRLLTEAKIFGIFGNVGSGKSTILEAISYVLYGRTERLGKNDLKYNLMNLKSDKFIIIFEFKMNQDEQYRFEVSARRSRKNFDDVSTPQRGAFKLDTTSQEWVPLPTTEASAVLGLSYDNFRRTIIIPQGKFADFLQLRGAERSEMLKEIFSLERFDLSDKLKKLHEKNLQELTLREGELAPLKEVSAELIAHLQEQYGQLEIEVQHQQLTLQELKNQELQQQKAQEVQMQLLAIEQKLSFLKSQYPAFEQKKKEIEKYHQCAQLFKNLLLEWEKTSKQSQEATHHWQEEQLRFEATRLALDQLEAQQKELQLKYDELPRLSRQKNDFELALKLFSIEEQKQGLQENIESLQKELLVRIQQPRQHIFTTRQSIKEQIQQLTGQIPDRDQLDQALAWYTQQEYLYKSLQEIIQEENRLKHELQYIAQTEITYLREKFEEKFGRSSQAKFSDVLHKQIKSLLDKKNDLEVISKQLLQMEHLVQYALTLSQNGGKCPVCGSLEHPEILQKESVRESIHKNEQHLSEIDAQILLAEQYHRELEVLSQRYVDYKTQLNNITQKHQLKQEEAQEHQKLFVWTQYPSLEAVKSAQQNLTQTEQALKKLRDQLELLESQLESLQKQEADFSAQLQVLLEQNIKLNTEYEHAIHQLHTPWQELGGSTKESIEAELPFLSLTIQTLQTQYESLAIELQKEKEKFIRSEESLKYRQEQKAKADAAKAQAQTLLNEQLVQQASSIEEVQTILAKPWSETEQQGVQNFFQEFDQVQKNHQQLASQLNQNTYNATAHLALQQEIRVFEQGLAQNREELGALRSKKEDSQKKLLQKEALQKELDYYQGRQEDIRMMEKLFRGQEFIKYVSSTYLKNLCEIANQRFMRLTHGQLRLEIDQENEFIVRDYLNEGRTRSVRTLSGGQTFQASLSLALALAESVARQSQAAQNFFFIDEGFGSQDKQTLQVVFDTLKSLQKENRIVGFISHVEELQDEISMHLHIERFEEEGSVIKESWK